MECCETQANNNCCNAICECGEQNNNAKKKKIVIDFMYLDLSVCERCQGTEGSLKEAISDVAKVLELTGTEVIVNKIHIDSEEKAIQYRFESSPTIRINGKDIQLETKESLCESCGDLCGDEVDCRVWIYNGKEYNVPPKAMIIDAILREIYGSSGSSDNDENKKSKNMSSLKILKIFLKPCGKRAENNSAFFPFLYPFLLFFLLPYDKATFSRQMKHFILGEISSNLKQNINFF